jgi:hypothetical protein
MVKQQNYFIVVQSNLRFMLKHFSKKFIITFVVVLCFILSTSLKAQTQAAFIMSSVGSMPGVSNTGMAIQFNSIATCLNVQNGIAVLSGVRGSGQFAVNCEVTLKINSLGIKLYPNPVNTVTNVKFINTPPLTDFFNLTIWTTEGLLLSTRKEIGYNLFQGLSLDMSALVSGTYVLKIESEKYIDALKFIKAN